MVESILATGPQIPGTFLNSSLKCAVMASGRVEILEQTKRYYSSGHIKIFKK
jgi:hypothetical protein